MESTELDALRAERRRREKELALLKSRIADLEGDALEADFQRAYAEERYDDHRRLFLALHVRHYRTSGKFFPGASEDEQAEIRKAALDPTPGPNGEPSNLAKTVFAVCRPGGAS